MGFGAERQKRHANRDVAFTAVSNLKNKSIRWTGEQFTELFVVFVVESTVTRGTTCSIFTTAFNLVALRKCLVGWRSSDTQDLSTGRPGLPKPHHHRVTRGCGRRRHYTDQLNADPDHSQLEVWRTHRWNRPSSVPTPNYRSTGLLAILFAIRLRHTFCFPQDVKIHVTAYRRNTIISKCSAFCLL